MSSNLRRSALALCALAVTALAAAPAAAQGVTEEQILAVLKKNPALVAEALQQHQINQQRAQQEQLLARARPVAERIIKGDKQVAFIGQANGKPIIEFSDYNCGFCKRFHAETATPLLKKGGYKILIVHTPILSDGSKRMAVLAAAANLQGKFAPAHEFLMGQSARDEKEADALIPRLIIAAGLDKARFTKALADGSAVAQAEHNDSLSRAAGVSGTPMIYANHQAIPGAIPLAALENILK